jgi:ZIP family zinc transporter
VTSALGWGALAASSLVIGAVFGLLRTWPSRLVGAVLGFGAGALISAVSFDLAAEGVRLGGGVALAFGLAAGGLTYFGANRLMSRRAGSSRDPDAVSGAGPALALGAFLDGIPEQLVLGIGLASGAGVSVGLLAAIFVSNLPEAIGSATAIRHAGRSKGAILRLWTTVAAFCALATVVGYAMSDTSSDSFQSSIDGFAAGALLVMLIDSMIPEAVREAGDIAGLVTVLGFAVAAGLTLG